MLAGTLYHVGILVFIGASVGLFKEISSQTIVALAFGLAILAVCVPILQIFSVVRISRAMQENLSTATVFGLLMLLPFLSLIVLVALNGMATVRLQASGIRVGLLGANRRDLSQYRIEGDAVRCLICGEPGVGDSKTCPICAVRCRAGL